MRQVLANLLDNAIKYTPTGGRVDLAAYAERAEPVIAAQDDGIGISPADLAPRRERGSVEASATRGRGLNLSKL
jgi:signal transduction histidine kinase